MIAVGERARIAAVAAQHGIDGRLLAALRQTENGRPGREFGVLIDGEDTWDKQAHDAARTIRHTVGRFWRSMDADPWDEATGGYSAAFLLYFSRGGKGYEGYAPLRAANDPSGLNRHHVGNLTAFYAQERGVATGGTR